MRFQGLTTAAALGLATLGLTAGEAGAATYTFEDVSPLEGDGTLIEDLITVDVTDAGGGNVLFTFMSEVSSIYSSVTSVYFDGVENLLGGFVSFAEMAGVDFEEGSNPANLPQGNTISFEADAAFQSVSKGGSQGNGINPGEELGITLKLESSFADLLAALDDGTLRIGLKVQAIGENDDSDALVTGGGGGGENPNPIPLPAAGYLLISAIGGLALAKRRRKA